MPLKWGESTTQFKHCMGFLAKISGLLGSPTVHPCTPVAASFWLMFRQSHWWDFLGVASEKPRRYSLTANSLSLCSYNPSAPSSRIFPKPMVWELFCGRTICSWEPQRCIVIGYGGLSLSTQRTAGNDAVLRGGEIVFPLEEHLIPNG